MIYDRSPLPLAGSGSPRSHRDPVPAPPAASALGKAPPGALPHRHGGYRVPPAPPAPIRQTDVRTEGGNPREWAKMTGGEREGDSPAAPEGRSNEGRNGGGEERGKGFKCCPPPPPLFFFPLFSSLLLLRVLPLSLVPPGSRRRGGSGSEGGRRPPSPPRPPLSGSAASAPLAARLP